MDGTGTKFTREESVIHTSLPCDTREMARTDLAEVTTAELAEAASVLRRLSPSDLERADLSELRCAGMALFSRAIRKEAFGEKAVVEFLAEQTKHRQTLKELKRLHELIRGAHRRERVEANACGLNEARKQTLAAIKHECAQAELIEANTPRLTMIDGTEVDEARVEGGEGEHGGVELPGHHGCLEVEARLEVQARLLAGGASQVVLELQFGTPPIQSSQAESGRVESSPLTTSPSPADPTHAGGRHAGEAAGEAAPAVDLCGRLIDDELLDDENTYRVPPLGDFRRICNVRRPCIHTYPRRMHGP